jgi:prevent-host-death family protein
MRSIGIRELKRGLSGYLAAVKDGEEIVVTDRGQPVARIVREPRRATSLAQALGRLVAEGVVSLPTRNRPTLAKAARVGGKRMSEIVTENRR